MYPDILSYIISTVASIGITYLHFQGKGHAYNRKLLLITISLIMESTEVHVTTFISNKLASIYQTASKPREDSRVIFVCTPNLLLLTRIL